MPNQQQKAATAATTTEAEDALVDYQLEETTLYKGVFYEPGEKVPTSLAQNLDRRKEQEEGNKKQRREQLKRQAGEGPQDERPLPDGFPALTLLRQAGITSVGDLKASLQDIKDEKIAGIPAASAKNIEEAFELLQKEGAA